MHRFLATRGQKNMQLTNTQPPHIMANKVVIAEVAYFQQTQSIWLEVGFWPPDKCYSGIYQHFSSVSD